MILIGVREASVPFSFLDAQKQPQGYSVELCQHVAEAIKAELRMPRLEVRYVTVSSANRIPALLENKIDLECGSTTNTRDRQKQVAFAYTTFVTGIKMLTKANAGIAGIEDLRGKAVVVTKGTTSEKMLRQLNDERVLKLTLLEAKDHDESFRAVEEGRAAAFPMDDVLLYGLISKAAKPQEFAVVGKYLSVEPYAIMMRRDEPQLERVVNRALERAVPVGRDPPGLRALVRHPRALGADEPVPQGSVLGPQHASGLALTRSARRDGRGRSDSQPQAGSSTPAARAATSGSRSPVQGGAISAVSTSLSNSGANRRMTRFRIRDEAAVGDEAELHGAVVRQDRHAHADVAGLRHPEHEAVDLRARRRRAAPAAPARWSSPPCALRESACSSWSCRSFGPAPTAASRPSVSTGW